MLLRTTRGTRPPALAGRAAAAARTTRGTLAVEACAAEAAEADDGRTLRMAFWRYDEDGVGR